MNQLPYIWILQKCVAVSWPILVRRTWEINRRKIGEEDEHIFTAEKSAFFKLIMDLWVFELMTVFTRGCHISMGLWWQQHLTKFLSFVLLIS